MSQVPIAYIDIRFFAHATEDLGKVMEAVQRLLPSDHIDAIVFRKDNLRGHYGNPIILFETRIKEREIIKAFVENLSLHLDELDKETLGKGIDQYIEKGSLYVRLDKQEALQGKFRLCTSDPIRVRMRFKKTKIEEIVKLCLELGMLK